MLELDISYTRGDFNLRVTASMTAPVVGIFGPSGSGKSTLLSIITGLLKPQQGLAVLNGKTLFDTPQKIFVPPQHRHIGLVFQDGQLFPHLSVKSNLLYGYKALLPAERHFHLNEIVDMLEIGNLLNRRTWQLSGGEKQRVALGRAILYSPTLLLLDEPLASLDDKLKQQILPFLLRIKTETKIPMLYVSHAIEELRYLTQEIWQLEDGKLQ